MQNLIKKNIKRTEKDEKERERSAIRGQYDQFHMQNWIDNIEQMFRK